MDISKAPDSIDRDTAWNTLLYSGTPSKIVSLLCDTHSHTCCFVRIPRLGLGAQYTIETVFKQECHITHAIQLAFRFGIHTIIPQLQELGVRVVGQVDGVLHNKPIQTFTHRELVYILLYADDTALEASPYLT
jgi:hypothetical protein